MKELLNRKTRKAVREAEAVRKQAKVQQAANPATGPQDKEGLDHPFDTAPELHVGKADGEPISHHEVSGLSIVVEAKAGEVRHGKKMHYDYGYIDGTKGVDGDSVDVFVGPDRSSKKAFIVHQMRRRDDFKTFDEDKILIQFPDAAEAKAAYLKHHDDPRAFGGMDEMTIDELKEKLEERRGKKIKKAVSVEEARPGSLDGVSDDDLKVLANDVAEMWASLYGSALNSAKQAVSPEQTLSMTDAEIESLRQRRKTAIVNDAALSPSFVYMVMNGGKAYGVVSLGPPQELGVEEFMAMSEAWPQANRLFSHGVLTYFDFGGPIEPDQVEFKAVFKMTREQLVSLATGVVAEAKRRAIDVGFPVDLVQQLAKDATFPQDGGAQAQRQEQSHPQSPDLYMPPNDPDPDHLLPPKKPKEYESSGKKIPGVNDPVDGPKGHEWGSNNPAQQEWDAGDYSHYGEGDSGGFYEFSVSGGARFVKLKKDGAPTATGSPTSGSQPVASVDLANAGKFNPVIYTFRTTLTKSAPIQPTVRMLLEAKVHQSFTCAADAMYGNGLIDRDERIGLSGLIGKLLDQFGDEMPYDLGARSIGAKPVEHDLASQQAQPVPEHPSDKTPPDIVMSSQAPVTVGPAAADPEWGPDTQQRPEVNKDVSLVDDLKTALVSEHEAIALYEKLLQRVDLDEVTRKGIKHIKSEETDHAKELEGFIGNVEVGKSAQFIVGEPPQEEKIPPTAPDVRGGHFEASDEHLVQQDGKKYPFTLQHHFRDVWSPDERVALKNGLEAVIEKTKTNQASATQLLEKLWRTYKPTILKVSLEKFSQLAQDAAEKGENVSTVTCQNLDNSTPKAVDLYKVLQNVINRGSVHTDFRVKSPAGSWLIGWTMDTPGIVLQTLEGKMLRVMRNKVMENKPGDRIVAQKKGKMAPEWLSLVSSSKPIHRVAPGGAGATKRAASEFRFLDKGEVVFGVQEPGRHEMFLSFEKNKKLNGRWEARAVEGDEDYWLVGRPDQDHQASEHKDDLSSNRQVEVLKSKSTVEERVVYGVVMEPETIDAHGDVISAEEIKNASYSWMEYYQQLGFQHGKNPKYPALPDGLRLLESYILDPDIFPDGIEFGSRHLKPGTWMIRVRADHDQLWADIKAGLVTGFSIGGFARHVQENN